MSKTIKLRKGLDIELVGGAEQITKELPLADRYGVVPDDFVGVTPKLLVRVEDQVKIGSPLFFDRERPQILFTSPVSGRVKAVNRGAKRKILSVEIEADGEQNSEEFDIKPLEKLEREELKQLLLKTGLWGYITQRPYGIVATPTDNPKAIFVSGFDSAPLAADLSYVTKGQREKLQMGFNALAMLTDGKVHLGLRAGEEGDLTKIEGVEITKYDGPHPAGNVGVQIHHTDPVNKGEVVWTVDLQSVVAIGRLFVEQKLDMSRIYAVTGSEVIKPNYVKCISGAPLSQILNKRMASIDSERDVRVIVGNVLTGRKADKEGFVGAKCNQITAIPEGNNYELLGWARPRLSKFSVSRLYFSWLMPRRKYNLDTNLNGGHRAHIVTGLFEKYLPMDIYPLYLLKAILAKDIDKMENLGIYEVVEEDFALCEFVDPSKNEIQKSIREGINFMIKELS